MEQTKAMGAKRLRAAGITGVILSVVLLITAFIVLGRGQEAPPAAALLLLLVGCYFIYMYIIGFVHRENLERANWLLKLAIPAYIIYAIIAFLLIIGFITMNPVDVATSDTAQNPLSILPMLLITTTPLFLYFTGASKNKKQWMMREKNINTADVAAKREGV